MCGIAGFHQQDPRYDRPRVLGRMLDRLVHRGPDADGTHASGDVFLGHRRLSIVDLSAQGNQPMFNEDRSVSIVYNGELYGYHDLRADLIRRGHEFRSTSDTEVILHLYEEKGVDCVQDLRGMFAFAIHDSRSDRIVLARDRLGIKPLYWDYRDGSLAFASEIGALLECPWIPRSVDLDTLSRYLAFFYVPAPGTMIEGVSMLEPGQTLVYERGNVTVRSYWKASDHLADPSPEFRPGDFEEELDTLLAETVGLHLNADVPVGSFLSGGVDSSGIVAYMSRFSPGAQTFCLVHDHPDYDERAYAARVAEQYQTQHVEVAVHGGQEFDIGLLDFLVDAYGEPFASPSAIAVHSVIREMKGRVKCVLSGDGADEIFGGYDQFTSLARLAKLQRVVPRSLARPLVPLGRWMRFPQGDRIARALDRATWTIFDFLMHEKAFFPFAEQSNLLSDDVAAQLDPDRSIAFLTDKLALPDDRMSFENLYRFMVLQQLSDYMLTKVDRASMAHSVEVRVPFVDHRVLELVGRAPASAKFDPVTPKPLLKKVLSRYLPDEILYRPKRGFAVHLEGFVGGAFWDHFRDLRADPRTGEFFDPQALDALTRQLEESPASERPRAMYRIWTVAVFLHWYQRVFQA